MVATWAIAVTVSATSDWYGPFAGRARVFLVFARAPDDVRLGAQRDGLHAGAAGRTSRDLVVIEVVGPHADDPRVDGAALRHVYGVSDADFAAILIGKDGGVKLRTAAPLSGDRLFASIDAMPMRRDELRREQPPPSGDNH